MSAWCSKILECAVGSASPDWRVKLDAALLVVRQSLESMQYILYLTQALNTTATMADGEARFQHMLPHVDAATSDGVGVEARVRFLFPNVESTLHRPTVMAARVGRWHMVKLLLDNSNPSSVYTSLYEATCVAAAQGHMEVLQNLMGLLTTTYKFNKYYRMEVLHDALLAAVKNGRREAFKWLILRAKKEPHWAAKDHDDDDDDDDDDEEKYEEKYEEKDLMLIAASGGNSAIVMDVCALYASRGWALPLGCVGAAIKAGCVAAVRHLLAAGSSAMTRAWSSAVERGDLLMLRALRDTPVGARWPTVEGLEHFKADLGTYNLSAVTWMVTEGGLGSAATIGDWAVALTAFRQLSHLEFVSIGQDRVLRMHREHAFQILSDAAARVAVA